MTRSRQPFAVMELMRRYRDALSSSWAQRSEWDLPVLEPYEAEFLPAALAVQEMPVSPAGRWVSRILMALVVGALLGCIFGRIDIVVSAEGKLIASGYTKVIASVDIASVRAIHVEDGKRVKAGETLIELDAREVDSDRNRALADRQNSLLQASRARALIGALDRNAPPRLAELPEVPRERWLQSNAQLQDQWRDFVAKRTRLDRNIERYGEELPLANQRAHDIDELSRTGDIAKHDWLEAEQSRVEIERQLEDTVAQRESLTSQTREATQEELRSAEKAEADSAQDERRAGVHSELLTLVSPVDGTVQELAVHTVGGVVQAAQALMQIVPMHHQVQMEAFLENKDVGFVREGQPASVKIDAFEYTKYGTVSGHVLHVSRDAIHDDKRGPLYAVTIALDRIDLTVEERRAALEPGMSGDVEIRTGTRRVIDYLLSPLIRHGHESLRER